MGINLPANVKAVLAQPKVLVYKQVQIVREYWNADLRIIVDVSDDVVKVGSFTNESTLKKIDWNVPTLTISMNNQDGRYSRSGALSIWASTLQRKPRACALIFRLMLPMPDGTLYELHKFTGSIEDCVSREESDIAIVDIVTKHMSHRALSVGITKASGDELVVLGTTW